MPAMLFFFFFFPSSSPLFLFCSDLVGDYGSAGFKTISRLDSGST